MIIAAVLFLVSAFGSAFPELGLAPLGGLGVDAIGPFIFYRVLGGVAVGLASVIAPMYVSSSRPARSAASSARISRSPSPAASPLRLFVNWGIGLQGDDNWVLNTGWRWMMVSMAVPSLAFFWLSFTVPESPSWLVRHGKIDEARRTLLRSAEPEEVESTLAELAAGGQQPENPRRCSHSASAWSSSGWRSSVLQQLMGLNAFSYYGPQILQRMGYHMDAAFLGVLLARCLNLLATMAIVLLVDRVGRKPLLIFGALVMGLAMMALGSLFRTDHASAYGLSAMCLYMAGLGMSFGPIVWIILSEIFPTPIRAQAMSLAIASQWGANFLVSFTFPIMFGASSLNDFAHGGVAFWIYGGFGILAAYVVLHYLPETRGMDHERVSGYWRTQAGVSG